MPMPIALCLFSLFLVYCKGVVGVNVVQSVAGLFICLYVLSPTCSLHFLCAYRGALTFSSCFLREGERNVASET